MRKALHLFLKTARWALSYTNGDSSHENKNLDGIIKCMGEDNPTLLFFHRLHHRSVE
jgi:hypothetical protein